MEKKFKRKKLRRHDDQTLLQQEIKLLTYSVTFLSSPPHAMKRMRERGREGVQN
jgi:hypothetical protein